ncbi:MULTISPECIES: VWA domain-containing protein [unclassified Gordonia (in: high G+C Gram-positive bacteria)]|uniref:vWA domain-containing protein n=1 Tax=unclassified Gordonia (in: high G+C Gram-positive bacteria) TaxID=2657482 RepID=UPI001F11594F|nr:VWA domain-containing protein [Gordonia sp. ABSL49_1]MCH5642131.1 VWA domain-containing protein [Gordonia sp. ABSL49_1]
MSTTWRWLVPFVLATLVFSACSSIDGESSPESGDVVAPAAVPTVVVVDASESMLIEDAPGPRWTAARAAVKALVGSLPPGTEAGVVVFGSQQSAKTTTQAQGCRDVRVVVPMGKVEPSSVDAALGALTPQGFTPIGDALTEAAKLLPDTASSMVLVSDGESNCQPDPCATAQAIRTQHPNVTISAVGFKTDAPSLQCVAQQGGGVFLTADNAAQMTARLAAAQNAQAARSRLSPNGQGQATIGDSIDTVAGKVPGFPRTGTRDGDRTIIVWENCTYVFDASGTLVEIAPGNPPGASGVTIDGVTAGSAGSRAVELYGQPRSDSDHTAVFVADEAAGTAYQIGYSGADAIADGTVRSVVLCHCLPSKAPATPPVLGRANYEQYAVGFGTERPNGISFASTASSTISDIVWESWGGPEAIGVGSSQQNGPDEPKTPDWLLATDLGWCNDVWTYRSVRRASSRAGLATSDFVVDICQGSRAEPTNDSVTLSPTSLLTFGGAGGVYIGDPSSKIPNTYVSKTVVTQGLYPPGTQLFFFRPQNSNQYSAQVRADPDGTIAAFDWFATDKGVQLGSSRADVRQAYAGYPRGTCRTSSVDGTADFFLEPSTGRYVAAVFDTDGRVTSLRARTGFTDGQHCPFE